MYLTQYFRLFVENPQLHSDKLLKEENRFLFDGK